MTRSKSNPLLYTHVDSYMFNTLHPRARNLRLDWNIACDYYAEEQTSAINSGNAIVSVTGRGSSL